MDPRRHGPVPRPPIALRPLALLWLLSPPALAGSTPDDPLWLRPLQIDARIPVEAFTHALRSRTDALLRCRFDLPPSGAQISWWVNLQVTVQPSDGGTGTLHSLQAGAPAIEACLGRALSDLRVPGVSGQQPATATFAIHLLAPRTLETPGQHGPAFFLHSLVPYNQRVATQRRLGRLDAASIQTARASALAACQSCFHQARLGDPDLSGLLDMTLLVQEQGGGWPLLHAVPGDSASMTRCIQRGVRDASPVAPTGGEVHIPLRTWLGEPAPPPEAAPAR